MITTTPMWPGFLIFFQTVKEHYSWKEEDIGIGRKKREENDILLLLTTIYESGTFD